MRFFLAILFFVFNFSGLAVVQASAQQLAQDSATQAVPERRVILWRDTDFFGADIQSLLDTSMSACESACLSDSACQAYTFNSNKDACFLKNGIGKSLNFPELGRPRSSTPIRLF